MNKLKKRIHAKGLLIAGEILKLTAMIHKANESFTMAMLMNPAIACQKARIDAIRQTPTKVFKPNGNVDKRRYKRFVTNRFKGSSYIIYPYQQQLMDRL